MRSRRTAGLRHLRANAVAYLALFVALGGTSAYAAGALPKASVGAKQLRKSAVTSAKVKDGSLRTADFAASQLPAGPRGERGPQGERGPAGPQGETGPSGASVFDGTLPSGETMSGYFGVQMPLVPDGKRVAIGVSFPVAVAFSQPAMVGFAPGSGVPAAEEDPTCAGSHEEPSAPAGKLCIYGKGNGGSTKYMVGNLNRFGFDFFFASNGAEFSSYRGVWAYTAP